MSLVHIPISFGELIDKITILRIKSERIEDREKLRNITKELRLLEEIYEQSLSATELRDEFEQLKHANERLWDIEDRIRRKERRKEFDEDFIHLARSVYITNDERADIKRRINEKSGSPIREEKSYADYKVP